MKDAAVAAIRSYLAALRAYSQCPASVTTSLGTASYERRVRTTYTGDAVLMPITKRPIRGSDGVKVDVSGGALSTRADTSSLVSILGDAIPYGASPPKS